MWRAPGGLPEALPQNGHFVEYAIKAVREFHHPSYRRAPFPHHPLNDMGPGAKQWLLGVLKLVVREYTITGLNNGATVTMFAQQVAVRLLLRVGMPGVPNPFAWCLYVIPFNLHKPTAPQVLDDIKLEMAEQVGPDDIINIPTLQQIDNATTLLEAISLLDNGHGLPAAAPPIAEPTMVVDKTLRALALGRLSLGDPPFGDAPVNGTHLEGAPAKKGSETPTAATSLVGSSNFADATMSTPTNKPQCSPMRQRGSVSSKGAQKQLSPQH